MDKEKWDDQKIESYLKELPKIADRRTKEDVLKRLKADDRLRMTEVKARNIYKWIPVAVAIAAVFLVLIVWPTLEGNESKQDIASDSSADETYLIQEEAENFSTEARSVGGISHVVLKETMGEGDIHVPMNLISQDQVVPVTIVLSAEQVAAEFQNTEVTAASLYERYVEKVDVGSLAFDAVTEKVDVAGTVSYFKYVGETGQDFLIPKVSANLTAEEALLNMANRPDDKVASVIPDTIHYDVTVDGEIARIHFEEVLELSEFEQEDALMLLEGFMLTAEQFNLAIQFENMSPLFWGTYDLTKPLPKPIAANPLYDLYE